MTEVNSRKRAAVRRRRVTTVGTGGAHPPSAAPNRESDVITVTRETDASRIHHSVGAWPVLHGDESVVLDSEPAALSLVPAMVRQLGIAPRNRETLRRLALLAERNAHPDQTSTLQ